MKYGLTLFLCTVALASPAAADSSALACSLSPADQQAITARVATHLQVTLNEQQATPTEVSLVPMNTWPALRDVQIEMPNSLRSRVPVTLTGFSCRLGKSVKETQWFRVSALREAWVYGRSSIADKEVMSTLPQRKQIDLAVLQLLPSELVDDLQGFWLKRPVNAGQPVLRQHLRIEPLVRRDAQVQVVLQNNGLMLRARGRALEHGALGEQISVQVTGAEGSVFAVVTGKGEVHAQM